MKAISIVILALGPTLLAQDASWAYYGGDAGGTRYSSLKQINAKNVGRLKVAWTYHTGALEPASRLNQPATFEATPILIEGTLYLSTPFGQVIALDPETGAERWKYDPVVDRTHGYSEVTSRGVSAWRDPKGGWRVFIGTIDARLIALDAKTGKPFAEFGDHGQVDLTRDVELRGRGDYEVTSPPAIVKDLVIVGSSIGDNRAADVERGIVRAFDARTGALRWTWDPIPWATHNSPRTGAGNAWSILSADPDRDLVFIPTGSASPDFYAGQRPGDNKWADSVVALRASTGELVWGFQVVHHDLWDYDVPSQPALFTFKGNIPAVAVTTKIGHLFLLDRASGKPLSPVEERPVPKSDVPGEEAWPTQPFPTSIAPLASQKLTPEDAWGITPEGKQWCHDKIASLRSEGLFTPPSLKGTIAFPGNGGGVNWGSAAIDPVRGVLVTNINNLPFLVKLIPRDQFGDEVAAGRKNRFRGEFARQTGTPYGMYREPLFSPSGLPCSPPPWGVVTAVELNSGQKLWETPLGSYVPGQSLGSFNLGGPIVTAGGLVFDAAADTFLRAFDIGSGKEVWKTELPAGGQATPMTYSIRGKQYVVICAGGHGRMGTKQGDAVVAYTLAEQ